MSLVSDYPKINNALIILRKLSFVFFAAITAYFLSIYLTLISQLLVRKLITFTPIFINKYVLYPFALEFGLFLSQIFILYLLGRFLDVPLWTTVISLITLTHMIDASVKYILNQLPFYYASLNLILLRIPFILITIFVGKIILNFALKRNTDEEN